MRSCEKASTLTSVSHDRALTVNERIGLTIHRLICGPCRLYKKQIETIRTKAQQLSESQTTGAPMDDDAKARIRERLREKKAEADPE